MESTQLKSPPKKKKDKVELAEIKKKCQSIKTNVQLRSMPPKSNLEEPIGDKKKSKYDKNAANHFIIAENFYLMGLKHQFQIRLARSLKEYKIQSILLTKLTMTRENLITKERMEGFSKDGPAGKFSAVSVIGEEGNKKDNNELVFDDLEFMFENLKSGQDEPCLTLHWSGFMSNYFPKLTESELELVEMKDIGYLRTFEHFHISFYNVDVEATEMKLSESRSKYINGMARRYTTIIQPEE